jgi:exocyst complex component 6
MATRNFHPYLVHQERLPKSVHPRAFLQPKSKADPIKSPQALPLSPTVTKINPNGISALSIDVHFLTDFVSSLQNPILQQNLDELQQTVALMESDNSDEFYDSGLRNRKYGQVNPLNGPLLLEKITKVVEAAPSTVAGTAAERLKGFGTRFGMR